MASDNKIVSLSGAPIFRYTDGEKEWEAPHGEVCIEEISDHIEKHIGDIAMVFHEIVSDRVHIDVHHVAPTKTRPFHTFITSGMSDLAMNLPEGIKSTKYLELVACLPEYWKVSLGDFQDERWYWPIRQLKFLARFPHKYDSWLGWGHTIPNGDPAEHFASNTKLNGIILLPPLNLAPDFHNLIINEDKTIHFMAIIPLYEEEMYFKLREGADALINKLDAMAIDDLIEPKRKSVVR